MILLGVALLIVLAEGVVIVLLLKRYRFLQRRYRFRESLNEMLRETEMEEGKR